MPLEQGKVDEADGGGEEHGVDDELSERLPGQRHRAAGQVGGAAAEEDVTSRKTPTIAFPDDAHASVPAVSGGRPPDRPRALPRGASSSLPVPDMVMRAVDHDIAAVRELERVIGVLLDQEDGQALASG